MYHYSSVQQTGGAHKSDKLILLPQEQETTSSAQAVCMWGSFHLPSDMNQYMSSDSTISEIGRCLTYARSECVDEGR